MKRILLYFGLLFWPWATLFAVDSIVVFNEIHYHPVTNETANEWIELHNQMAIDIDLSAWSLEGGIQYTFAEGTIIPGGGYLVIASNPSALRAASGVANVVGPFTGRLNNSTAKIGLRDRNERLMDEIEYRDGGKWPSAPDGSGATLAKRDENSISGAPENWTSSVLVDGTPGARNFPSGANIQRRTLIWLNTLWKFDASGTDLGTAWRDPAFNDASWSGRNNATLLSYWPFDGDANATRGTVGTLVGGVTATIDRNGIAGGALAFNGASQQYVSVAGGGGLNAATAGTISMWVKWSGTQDADCCSTFGSVLSRQANGQFSDDILALNTADPATARIVWRQSGGPAPVLITGTTAVGTAWHHIVVTFANTGSTLYVDGVPQGSAGGSALNNNPSTILAIGAWASDGGGFSTASIDDVAIWDQPLAASQVADLAAQTKTPLDFLIPESAIYYAGDGRLTSNDDLRRMLLPLGPTTYYFRKTFQFADDPASTQLKVDLAVDDGAVFYLNGVEVYRHNMPAGPISYSTLAASTIGDSTIQSGIGIPSGNLIQGTNVLAVEVHQAANPDGGMIFGAALNAVVTIPPPKETRTLLTLQEGWKFDASNTDFGAAWRAGAYNDSAWSNGTALIFAGDAAIDGIPPELISPITATASTQYQPDGRLAIRAVDGSGLVGTAHVTTPSGTMWLNNGTFVQPNDLNPFIQFDLGSAEPIRFMKFWNYNEGGAANLQARGISRADILTSETNGGFGMLLAGQAFAKAPGIQTDFSETINFGGIRARFVRMEKLTNFPGGDNNFVGLSEVQFYRDIDLRRTEVPLGARTYYFRKPFNFGGDPGLAELSLNAVVDDGAVFYLNGAEVYRYNMSAGAVTHSTLAGTAIPHATFTGPISISASSLVRGTNVFAVEVHQALSSGDSDMIFGATLTARVSPPPPGVFSPGDIVFNEITAASTTDFRIELMNQGAQTVNVGGYVIQRRGTSPDAQYTLSSQSLAAGQFLVLNQSTIGFGAVAGDKLFLLLPGGRGVADALEIHERPRARNPDGTGEWFTPSAVTLGAANTFTLHNDVVINEIMYHAPPTLELPAVIATNFIITLTNTWRYEQSGTDLGTAWQAPNYDDSAWPAGAGLLAFSTNEFSFAPKNTPLTLGPTTYYFRTSFIYTGAPVIFSLTLRHVIDDGGVIYFNGREIHRFRMPTGTIRYTNVATTAILNAILQSPINIPLTNLVVGTNVIAAEIHQAATTGDDIVFGAQLSAVMEAIPRVPFSESPEQWIELYNRGNSPANLTGWRIDEGIDFRFASNTMIAPGGYLVVAKDPQALLNNFPGINVTGPYDNKLSHRGERILLRDAEDNPANVVTYSDDGRWPQQPDAGGSSLELRDPRADNSAPESWAASNETGRSSWKTYSYRGIAAASAVGPDPQWQEFVIGLLNAGEVLLDDISVIQTPTNNPVQLIQNGTFDTGTNKWRIIGNHHGEVIDDPDQPGNKVLRLVATGSTEHMSNHGETTLANGRATTNGLEYLISFRAKWISGSRQFNTRLYFNRLARVTYLDTPKIHGTPGTRNTAFTPNVGPTYSDLRHDPTVPAPFAPVTVSIKASDPDDVAALTLWTAPNGGTWSSSPMVLSSQGTYAATVQGKVAGTVMQFYIEGLDSLGARSLFPSDGTNSRALFQFDDGLAATNGLHNVRLVTLTADADQLLRTVNLMSNERVGCTVIYDEQETFYDIGLRLKGSEHSRTTTPRLGFNIGFNSAQLFRGVHHTVAIDRSESTGFGQREMLVHQMLNHAGDVPTKYHDLIQVMAPRPEYTGSAEAQLARYSDVFLDDQFKDGSDGTVFEYELVYQLNPPTDNGTPEGNKVPNPDSVVGTAIRNLGDDKENYRWDFLIKNNEEKDDYSRLIPFCKWMESTGTNFTGQITNYIDPDQWLRGIAVNVLAGCGDSYGGDGAQHNVQFYAPPTGTRMIYFPHDMDAFFDANRGITPNADLTKIISVPAYARLYYCHLLDVMATTYNVNYMTRWANHFGRLLPAQNFASHLAFIGQRATVVANAVNAAVPNVAFAVTSNGGNNFTTGNNVVPLTGTAPLNVKTIEVNGTAYPVTWTSTTAWSLAVPILNGPNLLSLQGVDRYGNRLGAATDTITVTNTGSGSPLPVMINEWMADNDGPDGLADPADGLFQDWFELYNPNSNTVNLAGFFLTDNLSQPTKWQIPLGTAIPARGFLLVWADNEPEQNTNNVAGHLHAGFQLSASGEAIGLYNTAGVAQDTVSFGHQFLNISQGLFPDGNKGSVYFMTNWTPLASNILGGALRIVDVSFNGTQVNITWSSVPGRNYRVLYKDELQTPTWNALPGDMTATAAITSRTEAITARRFYRILRLD